MKVLVVGAAGMLGHKLCQSLPEPFEVWATVRSSYKEYARYGIFNPDRILGGVNVDDFGTIIRAVGEVRPDVIINSVGIIKQLKAAKDPITSLTINSLFPHQLANLSRAAGARMIHISTDCVFSGRKGMYTEADTSDAEDLYGRSKFLGETDVPGALTIRTSIIGRELQTTSGLVEWFLSQAGGRVKGYTEAIYTGFTTDALTRVIADILQNHPELHGMYQVSSDPINKYELLLLMKEAFGLTTEIDKDDSVKIDRSMDSSRFRAAAGFTPPTWQEMVNELAANSKQYEIWRS